MGKKGIEERIQEEAHFLVERLKNTHGMIRTLCLLRHHISAIRHWGVQGCFTKFMTQGVGVWLLFLLPASLGKIISQRYCDSMEDKSRRERLGKHLLTYCAWGTRQEGAKGMAWQQSQGFDGIQPWRQCWMLSGNQVCSSSPCLLQLCVNRSWRSRWPENSFADIWGWVHLNTRQYIPVLMGLSNGNSYISCFWGQGITLPTWLQPVNVFSGNI